MQYKTIKFSSPKWDDFGFENIGLIGQTPGNSGIWDGYKFEINNDCQDCDYWIVYESVPVRQKVKVPPGNTILVTSEEVIQQTYPGKYFNQFDRFISSRDDLKGDDVIHSHYVNAWFVRKTYDQLSSIKQVEKTKKLSVISSNLVIRPGHLSRYAFINKLIGHFKDRLDVYGRGFNFIHDKFDAIAPYQYSIAIENERIEDYWTEKIADCYLCNTLPFYIGCPNVDKYFNPESFIKLDLDDYKTSIQIIEQVIEEDIYKERLPLLLEAKESILNKYQFFPLITSILDQHQQTFNLNYKKRQSKKLRPIQEYRNIELFKDNIYGTLDLGKKIVRH